MHAAHTHIRSAACRSHALHCTKSFCVSVQHSHTATVYFAVCCPRSTSSVVWIWRKDKLPLCFLIVLRVCSTNPHIQKCCAFSRDVAWHDCLGSACADSLIWSWRTEAFEKVLCNLFLRLKAYPCSNFKNRKERPWKFHLIPDPRWPSKLLKETACLLAAQSWDLASAGRASTLAAGASGGESP